MRQFKFLKLRKRHLNHNERLQTESEEEFKTRLQEWRETKKSYKAVALKKKVHDLKCPFSTEPKTMKDSKMKLKQMVSFTKQMRISS